MASLYGAYQNKRNADKARNKQGQNIQAALGELTPENIQKLMQAFYSGNYNMLMPQMMGAQQSVANSAARSGLTGSGLVKQLSAGIPGQFAMGALNTSKNEAMNTAGQRASIQAGAPVGPYYNSGQDINSLASLASMYGLLKSGNTAGGGGGGSTNSNPWWIQGPGHSNVWT